MNWCTKCERELADTLEKCPFCGEGAVPKPVDVTLNAGPSEEELKQKQMANTLAGALKLGAIFIALFFLGAIIWFSRVFDSTLGIVHEWHFINSYYMVSGMGDDWGILPKSGVIRTPDELNKFLGLVRYDLKDPFYGRDEWGCQIDPSTIDFSKLTLVYYADSYDTTKEATKRIEDVTANFRSYWILLGDSPFTKSEQEALADKSNDQLRVQFVSVVAVMGQVTAAPKVEELGTPFSRPVKLK